MLLAPARRPHRGLHHPGLRRLHPQAELRQRDVQHERPLQCPRWVKAYWADSVKDSYKAGLEIIALNRNELLSDVLAALADIRVPIYAMNARQVENNCAVISLTIGINNTEHLNRVVARLSKVKDVLKVTRS